MPGGGPSRLTFRRLQVLIDHLPPESATKTAARDAIPDSELAAMAKQSTRTGHGPWSHTDLLLAGVSDRLDWVIHAVYAAQGGQPDKPEPLNRPGVAAHTRRIPDAQLDRLRRLHNREEA